MTRVEVLELAEQHRFRAVRVGRLTVRGWRAWREFAGARSVRELEEAVRQLRALPADGASAWSSPTWSAAAPPRKGDEHRRPLARAAAPTGVRHVRRERIAAPVVRANVALDHIDLLLADILEANRSRGGLMNAPLAVPLPAQRRIVDQAIAAAHRAGLQLPTFTVRFVERSADQALGTAALFGDDRYVLALAVDAPPHELRRVALHELQHLADYAAGRHRRLSYAQLEQRAIHFAAHMERRERL